MEGEKEKEDIFLQGGGDIIILWGEVMIFGGGGGGGERVGGVLAAQGAGGLTGVTLSFHTHL